MSVFKKYISDGKAKSSKKIRVSSSDSVTKAEKIEVEFVKKFEGDYNSNWLVNNEVSDDLDISCLILSNLHQRSSFVSNYSLENLMTNLEIGFTSVAFERLKLLLNINSRLLARVLRVRCNSVYMEREERRFLPDGSERILHLAMAFHRSIEVMEDLDRARQWFNSPVRALNHKTPLEFCNTLTGGREVCNLLGRIEHGVFS